MKNVWLKSKQINVLTKAEQQSIKGGKRLICKSRNRVMAKIARLARRGVSSHLQMTPDGDYCLDW